MRSLFYVIFGVLLTLALQANRAWTTHQQLTDPHGFNNCFDWRDKITWDTETWSFTKTSWVCADPNWP